MVQQESLEAFMVKLSHRKCHRNLSTIESLSRGPRPVRLMRTACRLALFLRALAVHYKKATQIRRRESTRQQ